MNNKLGFIEDELFSIEEDAKKLRDVYAIIQENIFIEYVPEAEKSIPLLSEKSAELMCKIIDNAKLADVVMDYANIIIKSLRGLGDSVNNMIIENKMFSTMAENNISISDLAKMLDMDEDDLFSKIGNYNLFTSTECRKLIDVLKVDKPELFFYPLVRKAVAA